MDEAANGGKYVSGRSKVNEAIAADLARHVAGSEVPTGGDITGVCACAARLGSSVHHACSA